MYHIFFYRCVGQRKGDDSYSIGSDIIFVIQERYFSFSNKKLSGTYILVEFKMPAF